MQSFSLYLTEIERFEMQRRAGGDNIKHAQKVLDKKKSSYGDHTADEDFHHIASHKLDKVHTLHHYKDADKRNGHTFIVSRHDEGKHKATAVITADALNHKKKSYQISGAYAHKDNKMQMHKVYSHMIKHLGHTLTSDSAQSHGGERIWRKLSKVRGVGIHGWDPKKKKAINLGRNLGDHNVDDTHVDTKSDTRTSGEIARRVVVAHKLSGKKT